jgi:hypothetical protein
VRTCLANDPGLTIDPAVHDTDGYGVAVLRGINGKPAGSPSESSDPGRSPLVGAGADRAGTASRFCESRVFRGK